MNHHRNCYPLLVFVPAWVVCALCATTHAAPVKVPSSVGERNPKIELFKYKDVSHPSWLDTIRGAIGIEIDYAGERKVETDGDFTKDFELLETTATTMSMLAGGVHPTIEAQFYTVELVLSFNDRIDFYTNLGWVNGFKYHSDPGSNPGLGFQDTFTYGGGVNIVLFKLDNGLQLFSDARYRQIDDLEVDSVYWPTGTSSYSSASQIDEKSEYEERQLALGLSKAFGFEEADQNHSIVLYAGAKYSQIDFVAKGYAFQESGTLLYDIGPFETKEPLGGFAGITYVNSPGKTDSSGRRFSIDLQVRVIDELGISINVKNRF